jgi:hypothetical protein
VEGVLTLNLAAERILRQPSSILAFPQKNREIIPCQLLGFHFIIIPFGFLSKSEIAIWNHSFLPPLKKQQLYIMLGV